MRKDNYSDGTSDRSLVLNCDENELEKIMLDLARDYLINRNGTWYIPKVAFTKENAFRRLKCMLTPTGSHYLFPYLKKEDISFIDDDKPFFGRADVQYTGIKTMPPYLFYLIGRILDGDISAYYELKDYDKHSDMIPFEKQLSTLKKKIYDGIEEGNFKDAKEALHDYEEVTYASVMNKDFDFTGLYELWRDALQLVRVEKASYDIGKIYKKGGKKGTNI